jgi:peptidoglycan/xylan/chitin deacetylase (PgdA/CDA1 family)
VPLRPEIGIQRRDTTSTGIHGLKMTIVRYARRVVGGSTIAAIVLLAPPATAQTCPGNSDALGTARMLHVDVATPRVGRKQYATTLPLAAKEIVLTFDDGPWPGTTPTVLDALKHECVRATFFLLGRTATAAPALAKRELAEGHTIGYHTFAHPLLSRMSLAAADAEVDRGIAAVDRAAYGDAAASSEHPAKPHTPFFRFPGFAASPALLARMRARGLVVFGADLWASDWNPMTPEQELTLVLRRLDVAGRGIILFHDTKRETARMLPRFLRAIKVRGYRVVHVVPGD